MLKTQHNNGGPVRMMEKIRMCVINQSNKMYMGGKMPIYHWDKEEPAK